MLFCELRKSVNSNISKKGAEINIHPKEELNDELLPCLIYPFIKIKDVKKVFEIDTRRSPSLVSSIKKICEIASYSASSGSITLECACVLPLFMFFCIQLLSIISIFALHSNVEAAVHQEVSQAVVQLYALEVVENRIDLDSEHINGLVANISILEKVKKRVGENYLNRSFIDGGCSGLHLAICQSPDDQQDTVDITLTYKIKPIVDILGFSSFTMANRCKMKIWSGYNIADESSRDRDEIAEEMVYVAETGIVYHINSNCSYLNPAISSISKETVASKRNMWGEKYYPCEICGSVSSEERIITEQGNRYHSSSRCSGLKRTVSRMSLTEAIQRGLGSCSRCG